MTGFILKKCAKGRALTSLEVKTEVGKVSSLIGIILNALLGCAKVALGVIFGLISVIADGLNNLSDCGACIVSFVGFKLAAKPADREHPFGHGKTEYIASMIVSILILVVAAELIKSSAEEIFEPQPSVFSVITVIILAVSMLVKTAMFVFNLRLAKAVDSVALKATAADSITDALATCVVLAGIICLRFTGAFIDGYLGLAVAVLIAVEGIKLFRDTMSKLLGQTADTKTVQTIKERLLSYDGVLGVHDLTVHFYGENNIYATAHIEVDANVSALVSHEITDKIERDFAQEYKISLVTHLDPVVLDDPETLDAKAAAEKVVRAINPDFTLHDFRLVRHAPLDRVIFDVSVPFGDYDLAEIKDKILKELTSLDLPYSYIVTVEHCID